MNPFFQAIQSHPRKRVPLDELRRHFFSLFPDVQNSPERGALLLQALRDLESAGAIVLPAAASWERSGSPPLPTWITLLRAARPTASVQGGEVAWDPALGFWPDLRGAQLAALKPINDFLVRRRDGFAMVPIKERSLEIFGDEKRLDTLCEGDALFGGRLQLRTIGCFRVPQPLPYRAADAPGKPVLVVENHNTYWSFGEWNQSAKQYAAVIYGGGENFRLTGRALEQAMRETNAPSAEYFGDMDPRGLSIPIGFNESVEVGFPKVCAALPFYAWLLANGRRREKPKSMVFAQGFAYAWLGEALAVELEALWAVGLWLPQEALGIEQLLAW